MATYIFTNTGDMPTGRLDFSEVMPKRSTSEKKQLRAVDVVWLNEASQCRAQWGTLYATTATIRERNVITLTKCLSSSQMQRIVNALAQGASAVYSSGVISGYVKPGQAVQLMDNLSVSSGMTCQGVLMANSIFDSTRIYQTASEIGIPDPALFATGHAVVASDVEALFTLMHDPSSAYWAKMQKFVYCTCGHGTYPGLYGDWNTNSTVYDVETEGSVTIPDYDASIFRYINESWDFEPEYPYLPKKYLHVKYAAAGNKFGYVLKSRCRWSAIYALVLTTVEKHVEPQEGDDSYSKDYYLDLISLPVTEEAGWVLSDGKEYRKYYMTKSQCESVFNSRVSAHGITLVSGKQSDLYNLCDVKVEIIALCREFYHNFAY